jgi:hypothetical protein
VAQAVQRAGSVKNLKKQKTQIFDSKGFTGESGVDI